MSIREQLQKATWPIGIVAALTIITVGVLLIRTMFSNGAPSNPIGGQVYYTVDDGKTYFADQPNKLPPFDKEGKQAVRCWVFTFDDGKTRFIPYLTRLDPAVKPKVESEIAKGAPQGIRQMIDGNTQIKAPGAANWEPMASAIGAKLRNIIPAGQNKMPVEVTP